MLLNNVQFIILLLEKELIIRKGAKIDWGAFGYSSIKNVYVNSESSNLNENAFYNSVVDNFILPVNYINPQFIKIPWEQQSVFVGFICFLYEDNGIHYGLIRSEKRTFVRFKYKPQEEKFEIGNVVTYEYKKRYSKHFNGNNIVYTVIVFRISKQPKITRNIQA